MLRCAVHRTQDTGSRSRRGRGSSRGSSRRTSAAPGHWSSFIKVKCWFSALREAVSMGYGSAARGMGRRVWPSIACIFGGSAPSLVAPFSAAFSSPPTALPHSLWVSYLLLLCWFIFLRSCVMNWCCLFDCKHNGLQHPPPFPFPFLPHYLLPFACSSYASFLFLFRLCPLLVPLSLSLDLSISLLPCLSFSFCCSFCCAFWLAKGEAEKMGKIKKFLLKYVCKKETCK